MAILSRRQVRDMLRVFSGISPEAQRAVEKVGERKKTTEGEGESGRESEREIEMNWFIQCCLGWRLVVTSPQGSPCIHLNGADRDTGVPRS